MPAEPITRTDLDNLATLFLDNMRQTEERMEERLRLTQERRIERIYDTQTVMMTEFHKWAAPMATWVKAHQVLISLAEERLDHFERKVKSVCLARPGVRGTSVFANFADRATYSSSR